MGRELALKSILLMQILLLTVNCKQGGLVALEGASSAAIVSGYWKNLLSVGPKTDALGVVQPEIGFVADKCGGTSHCIRLEWSDFKTVPGVVVNSYNVYRSTSDSFDLSSPIASTTQSYYVDTSALVPGGIYYYRVAAVVGGVATWGSPGIQAIRVVKPPANSAFVHKWMVNLEMCTLMGLGVGVSGGVDLTNDYRCAYSGFGHTLDAGQKYYNFSKHLIVDRFELGCNYSKTACSAHDPGDGSSTTDCIGTSDPSGTVSAGLNSVFFQRATGRCWLNTDGATTWVQSISMTTNAQRIAASSNAAGLPPIGRVAATTATSFCNARSMTIGGSPLTMRLPRRSEFIAFAAWSDDTIGAPALESGAPGDGSCNSNFGHGQTFNTTYPPVNAETLAGNSTRPVFTSGSSATRNCVTRYGIQDALGNWHEWTSTQTKQLNGIVSLLDPSNSDYVGITFDGIVGPSQTGVTLITTMPFYSIPLGLPLMCNSGCDADDKRVTSASLSAWGDWYALNTANPVEKAALSGGLWADGANVGRYLVGLDQGYNNNSFNSAIRCAAEM